MQTNDYYQIGIITSNNIIVCKLFVLDKNTWLLYTDDYR